MLKAPACRMICAMLMAAMLPLCCGNAVAGENAQSQAKDSLGWGHCASISPMAQAPTLDGIITPGEWQGATGTINFMACIGKEEPSANAMFMDLREGKTLCGYHDGRLYFAVVSALPPRSQGGKFSTEMSRDAELISDPNCVEIWLDPNRDRRESGEGDQAFYQLFVNSAGSIYDARLVPGQAPDKGWDADIQSAHSIDAEKKIWSAEISIPLKSLGWEEGKFTGKSMGALISRNYKWPWNQATWFPHGAPFVSWQFYPKIKFTADEPSATIESLGNGFWNAKPDFKLNVFNPGQATTAKVRLEIKTSDMPDLKDEKEIALPAHGSVEYSYAPGDGALHESADHLVKIRITSKDGSQAFFDYAGMWSHDPITTKGNGAAAVPVRWHELYSFEQKWAIRAEASPQQSVNVSVYPTHNLLRARLDASMLVADPTGADKDKLSDAATLTLACDGKELDKVELNWDLAKRRFGQSHNFQLKELPEGEYTVTAKFNKHPEAVAKSYARIKFPWEGTKLGVTDTIYPPFTAVQATAETTAVVGREYGVGDLGLWKSIKSLGKEILAAPITLKADGNTIISGKAKLAQSSPLAAVYEAEAQGDAVCIKSTCTTEIDGCMKVELSLLPGAKKSELKSLALEIPLKNDLTPLWHASTTAIRVNPVGKTPPGDGVAWDSRKFPNGDWIGNFTPYIWLGGMERGLCFFANNDRGWVLNWDDKKLFSPCQELIRKDGVLTLRLNLVQKPIVIEEERKIVIGLMASPGKPNPYKDWRGILAWGSNLGKEFDYLPKHVFDMGWGVEEVYSAAYPYNRDYSLYDARMNIPGTPAGDLVREKGWAAFLADWKKRNGLDKPTEELDDGQKYAISRAGRNVDTPQGGPSGYLGIYWDEYHADSPRHQETKVFNGEWGGNNMAASRRDFRCYYAAETVKRGIGLYFDNSFPHASRDLVTSDAYQIPGIGIQPSAGIWEQRDYHRRIWNIHREFGSRWRNLPMSMIHMTNGNVLPYITWNDMNVDLEWFYGPEPQQSKYSLPLLQAETTGLQSGCMTYALAVIDSCKTTEQQRMAERSKFGTMSVHEVKISLNTNELRHLATVLHGFGYGLAGTSACTGEGETVYRYWDENSPISSDNAKVKTLLVKRNNELLLLACSWERESLTAKFTFDAAKLGLKPSQAWDAEGTLEEQLARAQGMIEAAQKRLMEKQERVAAIRKHAEEKKTADLEARLKAEEAGLPRFERELKVAEEWLPLKEMSAKLPVSLDSAKGELSVNLEGYGVRLIRLK